jgi:hypothetical protein
MGHRYSPCNDDLPANDGEINGAFSRSASSSNAGVLPSTAGEVLHALPEKNAWSDSSSRAGIPAECPMSLKATWRSLFCGAVECIRRPRLSADCEGDLFHLRGPMSRVVIEIFAE